MEYKRDIFYDVSELTLEKRIDIIKKAFSLKTTWWVDILDCKKSFRRKCIEMSFEEIMKKFDEKCHFVVIHRQGNFRFEGDFIEVGFCTINVNEPDYFLWIYVPVDKKDFILKDLKERKIESV